MERSASEIRVALEAAGRQGDEVAEALGVLAELVARWAKTANLSAHRTPASVARHLVADAIALDAVLPRHRSAVDLGSGAGLPGLPLALLHPDRRYTIVEARERPHFFHREVVRSLGVTNVEPLRGRAEGLAARPHELAIAQAMGPPDAVLPLLVRWLAPKGHAAIPCAVPPPRITLTPELELEGLAARPYRVATSGVERSLWLARRIPSGKT